MCGPCVWCGHKKRRWTQPAARDSNAIPHSDDACSLLGMMTCGYVPQKAERVP